jgi:hypothetical protein
VSVFEPNKTDFVWTVNANDSHAAEEAAISMTAAEVEAGITLNPDYTGYLVQECTAGSPKDSYNPYSTWEVAEDLPEDDIVFWTPGDVYTSYAEFNKVSPQSEVVAIYTPYAGPAEEPSGLEGYASYLSMSNTSSTWDN